MTELTAELLVDRLDAGEVAVSSDGRLVSFVAAPVGRREEHPQSAVWLASADASESARRFTSGTAEDKAPYFAPDGSVLYFLSDREERKVAQLFRVRLDGGEAERLVEETTGAVEGLLRWPSARQSATVTRSSTHRSRRGRTSGTVAIVVTPAKP